MNIISKKALIVIITTFCCLNLQAKNNDALFKVAVVEDAAGTEEIMKGRYRLGLEKITKKVPRAASKYDIAMGGCVGNLMLKKLETAAKNCSDAVNVYKSKKGVQYRYLTSVAYSNRAVAYYKLGKVDAALSDLELAASIDDNDIVLENLSSLKAKVSTVSVKTQPVEQTIAD